MATDKATELLKKYNLGKCTDQERMLVEETFMKYNEDAILPAHDRIEELGKEVFKRLPRKPHRTFGPWVYVTAAAAAAVIIIATWLANPLQYTSIYKPVVVEIGPGSNKATFTTGGKSIELNDGHTGLKVQAGKVRYSDGTIVSGITENAVQVQLLETPRGGQYEVVLPDGTKVTLNAASSLEFPASFSGAAQRRVHLTGEGYFEVVKDKAHPFIVNTNDQDVKVLGTTFNINAYGKTIRTTLIEGSVKVSSGKSAEMKTLKPGEMSVLDNGGIKVQTADLALETAWKRGKIVFKDADLRSIMSTLERWYDIEVVYQSYPSESRFSGSVSRSKNISEVLNLIASTQEVHFKIEERRVVVMK
ncbi:MAG: FecR domain-containing protein [Bacteroidota bacterium]